MAWAIWPTSIWAFFFWACLLGLGDRRQEQRGQNGDDADDDEQFDQGESRGSVRSPVSARAGVSVVFHKRCHGYGFAVVGVIDNDRFGAPVADAVGLAARDDVNPEVEGLGIVLRAGGVVAVGDNLAAVRCR